MAKMPILRWRCAKNHGHPSPDKSVTSTYLDIVGHKTTNTEQLIGPHAGGRLQLPRVLPDVPGGLPVRRAHPAPPRPPPGPPLPRLRPRPGELPGDPRPPHPPPRRRGLAALGGLPVRPPPRPAPARRGTARPR